MMWERWTDTSCWTWFEHHDPNERYTTGLHSNVSAIEFFWDLLDAGNKHMTLFSSVPVGQAVRGNASELHSNRERELTIFLHFSCPKIDWRAAVKFIFSSYRSPLTNIVRTNISCNQSPFEERHSLDSWGSSQWILFYVSWWLSVAGLDQKNVTFDAWVAVSFEVYWETRGVLQPWLCSWSLEVVIFLTLA